MKIEEFLKERRARWISPMPILALIKSIANPDIKDDFYSKWSWTRNPNCKYITIRVDMRDGRCLLLDRNDHMIEVSELLRQFSSKVKVKNDDDRTQDSE